MAVASRGGMGYELLSNLECEIIVEMGGMKSFQNSSEEGLPFLRKEFEQKVEDSKGLKCQEYPVEERATRLNFDPESIIVLKEKKTRAIKGPELKRLNEILQ
jgi:hypothetical protein